MNCWIVGLVIPFTYAVVASLVELSPADWVVAVVPFGKAGVPERLAAVVAVEALPDNAAVTVVKLGEEVEVNA